MRYCVMYKHTNPSLFVAEYFAKQSKTNLTIQPPLYLSVSVSVSTLSPITALKRGTLTHVKPLKRDDKSIKKRRKKIRKIDLRPELQRDGNTG